MKSVSDAVFGVLSPVGIRTASYIHNNDKFKTIGLHQVLFPEFNVEVILIFLERAQIAKL